jgi:ribosomal protein S27AE
MALRRSKIVWEGETWSKGDTLDDLDAYLRSRMFSPEPDDRFVHPVCKQCGGDVFSLEGDGHGMRRWCGECVFAEDEDDDAAGHFICESGEFWDEAEADDYHCPCRQSSLFRVSVAFNHVSVQRRDANGSLVRMVKWIYVGGMCVRCGVVGLYADWIVRSAPTYHLYDLA